MAREIWLDRQADLALELGVSVRTVRDYQAEGMPGEPGKYPLNACREWVAARRDMRKPVRDREEGKEPTSEWLERQREYRAKLLEHQYARARKELVEASEVRDWLASFAANLRGFGDRLGKECPKMVPFLDAVINQAVQSWKPAGQDGRDGTETTERNPVVEKPKRATKRRESRGSGSVSGGATKVRRGRSRTPSKDGS